MVGKIQPWWGHDEHFHVRLKCPADGSSPNCRPKPEFTEIGCDTPELAWWFSDEWRQMYEARKKWQKIIPIQHPSRFPLYPLNASRSSKTMDLVERELRWVLKSPAFFSAEAAAEARSQLSRDFVVALPGSVIYPDIYDHLSSAESSSYLSEPSLWKVCVNELHEQLPLLTSGRLGLRFEQYLLSVLRAQFGSTHVRHRWAVRETLSNHSVKTWGEYDFLIFNASMNRVEHWESSVKFYLQIKDNSDWKWCWGPGVVDRLDLKGPKTFLQQLALSSTELGHASILAEWSSFPLVKRVFAKGTIFTDGYQEWKLLKNVCAQLFFRVHWQMII